MSSLFRYIAIKYLKIFMVIFLGLVLFYVGFDYLSAAQRLPNSANLRMLYVYYQAMFASDVLMPVALVFSMVATKIMLIRSNELVAFYAIGYSKAAVLKPFIIVSLILTMFYISIHTTKFAYAEEFVRSIYDSGKISRTTKDLFFKYDQYYIYFSKLYPIAQRAENIRIFRDQGADIVEVIQAKMAIYKDDQWFIPHAKKILKSNDINFGEKPLFIFEDKDIELLKGFKPEILDHIHEGKVHYSIIDAWIAIDLLNAQKANASQVYTALYRMLIYPFFAPALMIIIFFFVPISSRSFNISLFSFIAILTSLLIWGTLFALGRLTHSGMFSPFEGVVLPVLIIFVIASLVWVKKTR